jgi:hypothetical protein
MKKLLIGAIALLTAITGWGTTLNPVQLLNPAGSTSGQVVLSSGPSSTVTWGSLPVTSLAAQAANTVVSNATGSSASPTAFVMPSCSAAGNALQWTSGSGFSCASAATSGRLIGIQVFTAGGTYTPTAGTNSVIVEAVGGGGGGGGAAASGAGGAGGGAGAYAKVRITSAFSGVTVTIGAAGAAGTAGANAGGAGGATSFGAIVSCPGGSGGNGGTTTATIGFTITGGNGGGTPTISGATTLISSQGSSGGYGLTGSNLEIPGIGAASVIGQTSNQQFAAGASSLPGIAGVGPGSGGSGGATGGTGAAAAGGAGKAGLVIVYEYN